VQHSLTRERRELNVQEVLQHALSSQRPAFRQAIRCDSIN
jgi:hypothetical protein